LDRDGTLWAATQGGLSRIKDGHVATLTGKNGLPCDAVNWVMEDDAHSFWLGTACGLLRIARSELEAWAGDPKRKIQTTVFDTSDGVRSHATTGSYSPRVAKSKDGKIWFLPFDGVSVIDPQHLSFNKLPPPVHIEEIIADRKKYTTSSNLHLPPLVRDLEIDYTALSLAAPEKVFFRVQLEGRDPDWKDVGTERKAFYSDLPPRNYRFRVRACNNSGVWNETGASFDFSIDPRYYQTAWFKIACAAAFLTLLWGLYRLRLYQIAREFNVRLDERVGERTRLARDLHDTLLQSFQGVMLRLQVVEELLPPGKAKEQLEQTLERADQAIAEGRSAVHDLRSSTTVTNELAQAMRSIADELATEGSPTFRLVVEGPVRELHPILRDEVYRIAREALRNAFNHARAHHIEAEITYGERLLRLRIRDDGRGIPPETLESGRSGHYGLNGMRERARQAGASLDIWSSAGSGTEIDLSLPGSIAYGKSTTRSRLQLLRKKVR
jgi:signal transduction histidine kinase